MPGSWANSIRWEWLVDDSTNHILEKIREVCEEGMLPSLKRDRLGTTPRGDPSIDGLPIPYELLPYFFRSAYAIKTCNHTPSDALQFSGIKYEVFLGGKTLSFIEHSDGTEEFKKNDNLHCTSGPARRHREDGVEEYFINGYLHRVDGPAYVSRNKRLYSINGRRLSLIDFIENNPISEIISGRRGESYYTITKWDKYAVVSGLDGTKALVEKTEDAPNEHNFLLGLVSQPVDKYKVLLYEHVGDILDPIYDFVRASGPWQYVNSLGVARLSFANSESSTDLAFDFEDQKLKFSSTAFDTFTQYKIDLGFGKSNYSTTFPKVFVKRDSLGRKHCSDGPAVLNPNGKEEFYIHGCRITKQRFNKRKFDLNRRAFYWHDEQGKLHGNSWTPAEIFHTGETRYYHHGLLHSDIFPAIDVPGEDFDILSYFIYGNEISAEEFKNYQPATHEVAFLRDEKYHRIDGPARIIFKENGLCDEEYYFNGVLHNTEGPAKVSSRGAFEWRHHGKLHRLGGPAVWDPQQGLLEFYNEGQRHNDDGPAVVHSNSKGRLYEFWKHGKKSAIDKERDNMASNIPGIPRLKLKSDRLNSNIKESAKMSVNVIRPGTADSDSGDRRLSQITSGTKLGLKKGAVRVTSEKAAEALAGALPIPDNIAMTRLVQLMLLLGSAELVERLPDSVGGKVGLTSERRTAFSGLNRYVSGEVLGKDAVNIVTTLAPTLLDALRQLSADEITELSQDIEVERLAQHEVPEVVTV